MRDGISKSGTEIDLGVRKKERKKKGFN